MALAGLTSRGRTFVAAGITCIAGGVVLDQRDLVRVGILLLALPVTAAIFLTRARYRIAAAAPSRPQPGARRQRRAGRAGGPQRSRMTTPLLLAQDALAARARCGRRRGCPVRLLTAFPPAATAR